MLELVFFSSVCYVFFFLKKLIEIFVNYYRYMGRFMNVYLLKKLLGDNKLFDKYFEVFREVICSILIQQFLIEGGQQFLGKDIFFLLK